MQTSLQSSELNLSTSESVRFSLKVELDDDRPIYLSGNFNDWELRSKHFELTKIGPNEYELDWPKSVPIPDQLEYKYLKGGWESVELDRYGNRINNRLITNPRGEICDVVSRWRIEGLAFNKKFLPILDVIKEDYEIPQMGKHRRICALLPHDYDENNTRYPVLYMHDGQNLFDETAPFGNWAVDQKLSHPGGVWI